MSVYKRKYQAFQGRLQPKRARLLVLIRYGFMEVWASKVTAILLVIGLIPFLGSLVGIYLANNPLIQAMINGRAPGIDIEIGEAYFMHVLATHCMMALVLASWVAPRLIGFDMSDNALATILSHSISRRDYIVGKLLVLLGFLSAVTWIPLVVLFFFQAYCSKAPWAGAHWYLLPGVFLGSFVWILLLSLLGLAASSSVKWRMAATGSIFAVLLVSSGFGEMMKLFLRSNWGGFFSLTDLAKIFWESLMHVPSTMVRYGDPLPVPVALTGLGLFCVGCIAVLNARVRAREVVKG